MVSVGMGLADRWLRAFLQASIPSLVGMFVYKEDTSSGTRQFADFFKLVEEMRGVLYVRRESLYQRVEVKADELRDPLSRVSIC